MNYTLLFLVIIGSEIMMAQCPLESVFKLRRQSQIDSFPINFPNCKNLGRIGFGIEEEKEGDITDLTPLLQLNGKQKAAIFISNNKKLRSLEGLNNIDSLEESLIVNKNNIQDIKALSKLKFAQTAGIQIDEDSLTSLEGLDNLESVLTVNLINNTSRQLSTKHLSKINKIKNFTLLGQYLIEDLNFKNLNLLFISENSTITNLSNLNFLDSVNTFRFFPTSHFSFCGIDEKLICNNISIKGKDTNTLSFECFEKISPLTLLTITNIDTIDKVETFNESLQTKELILQDIKRGPKLLFKSFKNSSSLEKLTLANLAFWVSMDGLEYLNKLNSLVIKDNNALVSINALNSEENKENYQNLNIINNPNLNHCQVSLVCKMINALPQDKVKIANNAGECITSAAIKAACKGLKTTDENAGNIINIYPNPSSELLNISTNYNLRKLVIFNAQGKLVLLEEGSNLSNSINISNLQSGLYFIKILNANGSLNTSTFIKL